MVLENKNWVLKDWPSGYHFYDHHKGNEYSSIRHDLYLIGGHAPMSSEVVPTNVPL